MRITSELQIFEIKLTKRDLSRASSRIRES